MLLLFNAAYKFVLTLYVFICDRYCKILSLGRQDKESWIRSKYVEKKFIHKLPETGRGQPLRRSSARRLRGQTQDKLGPRPPLKPKPNRATLPRNTGLSRTPTHIKTHMLNKNKTLSSSSS